MTKQTAIIIDFAAVKRARCQRQPEQHVAVRGGSRLTTAQRDRQAEVRARARAAL